MSIFKKSFDLFSKNIKTFAVVVAIFFLVMVVLGVLFGVAFSMTQIDMTMLAQSVNPLGLVGLFVFIVIAFLLTLVYSITIIKTADALAHGQKVGAIEMYKEAKDSFKPFCIVSLLVFSKVILWSLLFIIPGIIFGVLYGFAQFCFLIDGKKGKEALVASKMIIKTNLKEFSLKMLGLLGVYVLIGMASGFLAMIPYAGNIILEVVKAALGVYAIIFSYYLYQDLKGKTVSE